MTDESQAAAKSDSNAAPSAIPDAAHPPAASGGDAGASAVPAAPPGIGSVMTPQTATRAGESEADVSEPADGGTDSGRTNGNGTGTGEERGTDCRAG